MDEEISAFFLKYGDALGRNDLPAIAACYSTPSLVVDDSANISVPDGKAVEAAFAGAAEVYSAKRLIGAVALINRVDRLTDRLAFVDVTWEYKDVQGGMQPGESYRYLVRVGAKTGICAVIPVA